MRKHLDIDKTFEEKYDLRRMDYLYESKGHVMAFSFFCSVIFIATLYKQVENWKLGVWYAIYAAYIVFRLYKCKIYQRRRERNEIFSPEKWEKYFLWTSLAAGLIWGLGELLLISPNLDAPRIITITILFVGISTGAMPGNASSFKSYVVFAWGVLLPGTVAVLSVDLPGRNWIACMYLIYCAALYTMAKKVNLFILNNIELNLKNEELVKELQASNEARITAEQQALSSSKLAAIGEMASGIAHEINNPLAILKGNLSFISRLVKNNEADLTKYDKYFEKSFSGIDRIAKIIMGLKKVSRDGSQDEFVPIAIGEIIEDSLSFTREKLRSHGIEVIMDVENPGAVTLCQQVQLSQVLINLITNAMHAIEGSVNPWIKISSYVRASNLIIEVIDSGSGLPDEVLAKIFQPFFTTKEVGTGTGLGLSISKGIIDAHNGSIKVASERPNTCFVITLPLHSAKEEKIA